MEIETIRFLFFGHPLPKSHGAKFIESYSLLKQRSPLNNHQNVAISCHKCALFWYNTFSNKIIKWRRLCLVFWKTFKANKIFLWPLEWTNFTSADEKEKETADKFAFPCSPSNYNSNYKHHLFQQTLRTKRRILKDP